MFDIEKLNLPNCPYCEAEVGYFDAFISKNRLFHKCANCARKSVVKIKPSIYRLFIFAQIIATAVFVFTIIMGGQYCLLGLAVILAVSVIFYVFTPFSVKLMKSQCETSQNCADKKHRSKTHSKNCEDTSNEIYSN